MPAMVRTEFALALNQVATERGIDISIVIDTIKSAILAAYYKDYAEEKLKGEEGLFVDIDPKTGEAHILRENVDITPPGFGRIAAQTAKQVILQRIREAEKNAILSDYATRVGNIINGMILRFDGPNIIVDIGRAQGIMPPPEQVRTEHYHINQRLSFYLKDIREGRRGNEIVLSRADAQLVVGLFQREVPEVANKSVEVKAIAREAGSRTKIAVHSVQSGVDPVGSCVGQKGVRVQAVINELGQDEKIDVIQWSEDDVQFITASLAPAKDMLIKLDSTTKTALVLVPEEYLSLAIGKGGQNVRIASKLAGYTIDIRDKNAVTTSGTTPAGVFDNLSVSESVKEKLKAAGITTMKSLRETSESDLKAIKGVGPKALQSIKDALTRNN
ncbi:transcription termination factor NusA [Candidatus Roizmanbacteria bacterium RIFCSPLOWO2_01_FULL_45_11]|uniref:Transcription termination/antitermination protein NusA n=1 Tax=Candidatus Roizmanbacteria bacterium RIFCSPLOWO2_01_FULL_45_11 TaxID=1802070 RepID=A0A1F7JIM7_9BACT|nr:MAG: transcription termination factor NusA [Candidatus Roizmanbacteria bacterium RIFCSPLOWO2_01_FULL_45_11]